MKKVTTWIKRPPFCHLLRRSLWLLVLLPAFAAKEYSQMHEALDALRAARTSTKPFDDLHAALDRLKAGHKNKAGHRAEAARLTRKAIDELKAKRKIADRRFSQNDPAVPVQDRLNPDQDSLETASRYRVLSTKRFVP